MATKKMNKKSAKNTPVDDMLADFTALHRQMQQMSEHMNKMFAEVSDRMNKVPGLVPAGKTLMQRFKSHSSVKETPNAVVATFNVPGMSKKDLTISVTDHAIEVKGHIEHKSMSKKAKTTQSAFSSQSYYQMVSLPSRIDPDKARAILSKGLLKIEAPKVTKKSKKLLIK